MRPRILGNMCVSRNIRHAGLALCDCTRTFDAVGCGGSLTSSERPDSVPGLVAQFTTYPGTGFCIAENIRRGGVGNFVRWHRLFSVFHDTPRGRGTSDKRLTSSTLSQVLTGHIVGSASTPIQCTVCDDKCQAGAIVFAMATRVWSNDTGTCRECTVSDVH